MEMKASTIVAALVAALLLVQTLAIPLGQDVSAEKLPAEKRPKYMDTKDLEVQEHKQQFLEVLSDLVEEGILSPSIFVEQKPDEQEITARKRGHLGICYRITPSGNPAARPCWIRATRRFWR